MNQQPGSQQDGAPASGPPDAQLAPGPARLLALLTAGLGLVIYFLGFFEDELGFSTLLVGPLLVGGGLLAGAAVLPKVGRVLVPAAVAVATGTLLELQLVAGGTATTIEIVALVLAFLQLAAVVGAVLLDAGILRTPVARPSAYPQQGYGAGNTGQQYGQQGQYGGPPPGYGQQGGYGGPPPGYVPPQGGYGGGYGAAPQQGQYGGPPPGYGQQTVAHGGRSGPHQGAGTPGQDTPGAPPAGWYGGPSGGEADTASSPLASGAPGGGLEPAAEATPPGGQRASGEPGRYEPREQAPENGDHHGSEQTRIIPQPPGERPQG